LRSKAETTEGSMYSGPKSYYVYIMTNRSKMLYTAVTGRDQSQDEAEIRVE